MTSQEELVQLREQVAALTEELAYTRRYYRHQLTTAEVARALAEADDRLDLVVEVLPNLSRLAREPQPSMLAVEMLVEQLVRVTQAFDDVVLHRAVFHFLEDAAPRLPVGSERARATVAQRLFRLEQELRAAQNYAAARAGLDDREHG
jgi:hypothetical protein